MPPRTFATADIGSNTVHLLIAQTDGGGVVRLDNQSYWLGLGESVAVAGEIDKDKQRDLLSALVSFKKLASSRKAQAMYVFATEAVRRASNHKDVLTSIRQQSGIEVDVISPEREAELAVRGAMLDSIGEMPTAFFDIGGGSAQIARIEASGITALHSLPIGTGTLRVAVEMDDPVSPEAIARLHDVIDEALDPVRSIGPVKRVVGGGGVARGVLRALHPDRDRIVEKYEVDYLERTVGKLTARAVSRRFGIGTTRAKTLLPGVTVIARLLDIFSADHVLVSEFGIREGAVLELAEGGVKAAVP